MVADCIVLVYGVESVFLVDVAVDCLDSFLDVACGGALLRFKLGNFGFGGRHCELSLTSRALQGGMIGRQRSMEHLIKGVT